MLFRSLDAWRGQERGLGPPCCTPAVARWQRSAFGRWRQSDLADLLQEELTLRQVAGGRGFWWGLLAAIVVAGLLSRVAHTGFRLFDKYQGDALYAAMVY